MPHLMTKEAVEEMVGEIKTMTEDLESKRTAVSEAQAELKQVRAEVFETKSALDELANLESVKEKEAVDGGRAIFYLEDQIQKARKALAEDERKKRIQDLYNEQPDFCTTLEKRLQKKQEEMHEEIGGFIELAEPAQFVRRINAQLNQKARFDEATIEMRSAKQNFETAVYELCEKKIDGTKITPADAMTHLVKLDAFLMSNSIAGLWQLG